MLRPATPDDAAALVAIVVEGFEGYRAFTPAGWEPPAGHDDEAAMRERLAAADTWCAIAEVGGEIAGHAAFLPAAVAREPVPDPRLAHLWQLFVRRPFWGGGAARALHGAAVDAAVARGFATMRLFTPAGQGRARRFYEREGWAMSGPPREDAALRMPIVEYRLVLPAPPPGSVAA